MSKASSHRQIMEYLTREIVEGHYAEGEQLPRADDIGKLFKASLSIVRECLQRLDDRGLVMVRHGTRTRVRGEEHWSRFDPDILAIRLEGDRAAGVLAEYLECRRLLEVEAAGLAAERGTDVAVDAVAGAYQRMRSTAEEAQEDRDAEPLYHQADIDFHRAVMLAAGNPALGQMTEPIHRALTTAFGALARPRERFMRGLPEHERILDAIRERDADAAREAMRSHLLTVEKHLREYERRRRNRTRRAAA